MSKRGLSISNSEAVDLAELFRLLGDASRLRIVVTCLDKPCCVSYIAEETCLSPSLVSHHLRLLRDTRMLRAERRGRQVFYVAANERVQCIIVDMLDQLAESEQRGASSRRSALAQIRT